MTTKKPDVADVLANQGNLDSGSTATINKYDETTDTIEPIVDISIGKYDEQKASAQYQDEQERIARMDVLDEAIEEKKQKLEFITHDLETLRAVIESMEEDHAIKLRELDQKITASKELAERQLKDIQQREASLSRRGARMERRSSELQAEREEAEDRLRELNTEHAELEKTLHTVTAAIGNDLQRRRKLEVQYSDAKELYAQQINKRIERRDALDRDIADLEITKRDIADKINAMQVAVQEKELFFATKERTLAEREKEVQNRERRLLDRQRLLRGRVQELRGRGIALPDDINESL